MKQLKYLLLLLASGSLLLNACEDKESRPITQADTQSIALSEAFIFDGFNAANSIGIAQSGVMPVSPAANIPMPMPSCGTVTVINATFPIKVTKEYNEAGCFEDGAYRKGKLTVELTDFWWKTGAKLTITPENYYVNGIKVDGVQTYENTAASADVFSYKVTISNGKLTAGTLTHTWNCERIITIDNTKMQYTMSGNGRGVTWTGLNYALDITQTFVRKFICPNVEEGILEIICGDNKAMLDYGYGDDKPCDNKALYTVGNNTYEIILGLEKE